MSTERTGHVHVDKITDAIEKLKAVQAAAGLDPKGADGIALMRTIGGLRNMLPGANPNTDRRNEREEFAQKLRDHALAVDDLKNRMGGVDVLKTLSHAYSDIVDAETAWNKLPSATFPGAART